MITVLHARPYVRFIVIQSNLRKQKLHRRNQAPIFLEAVFAIEIMEESQSNMKEKDNATSISKDDFFSQKQTHPLSHQ